jgi:molybdenum cofactor biosynthesis enzyme MoaA
MADAKSVRRFSTKSCASWESRWMSSGSCDSWCDLMTEKKANFVPVGALDKRVPTRRELLRGLVRQAPFVVKNFRLYFRNGWRRHVLRTKVVAPYAVTFYVTHKCNLACSYCTQKEPDVFSEELGTADTIRLLRRIRKESDSIVITGGEPTLRGDIEEIVAAARFDCRFRSVLLITNGTLLDRKAGILAGVTGLVVSLDALAADPTNPLSKPAALPKVMENLEFAKERLGSPRRITISTVIEEWNIGEVERLLDWCGEQGFVFAAQSAQMEKMPNLALLRNAKYQALVEKSSRGGARERRQSTERRRRSRRCCGFGISSAIRPCFRGCTRTGTCFILASLCGRLRGIC